MHLTSIPRVESHRAGARLEKVKSSSSPVGDLVADIAAALREAREEARVAKNALSLFLANFSHELRTPLNHIIGFSDLIDQKISRGVTEGIDRHAANIRQSGSNLLDTLNRIIRFAEMETGAHDEPDLEIFVADDVLTALAEWATPVAQQRGNSHRLTIPEPIGSMRSDSSFIEAALRQLVENACKHSRDGSVEIFGERLGHGTSSRIRVVVSDEGPGIDPLLARTLLDGRISPGDPLAKGGMIEAGRVTKPLKGIMLMGSGQDVFKNISMVANDLLIIGGGTCGKDGQGKPVGFGNPTLKVDKITVGGQRA